MPAANQGDLVATDGYFAAPAHLRQARCDAIQAAYRAERAQPAVRREPEPEPKPRKSIRRDPPPLPMAIIPTDDPLKTRLAEELEYARRMIETMGDSLSADPQLVMRHMVTLQSVDIAGQILGHVANVIRSSDPDGAVDLIGMSELRGRLKRAGGV
jgi:hypothetical protein